MTHIPSSGNFHILTLGCKINQYETQSLREAWIGAGLIETGDPAEASFIVVNSCAVTAKAVRDVRAAVRRMRRANPGARILVTGCAAQIEGEGLSELPGVEFLPQSRKAELLGTAAKTATVTATGAFPDFRITRFARSRPVVKVQDGCSHRCTYCVVPLARGESVSREPGEVVSEAAGLLEAGYAEIMVSGVNLRHYGRDFTPPGDFWGLLRLLEEELAEKWAGRARFRLSSLDPAMLTGEALDFLSGTRLFCPHLHLSLQSLSPRVLRRMNRGHYKPEEITAFLDKLGKAWPIYGLGADLLTGFPGETDLEFRETLAAVRALPLTYAHVFPYSPRPGTPAASYSGQVAEEVKKERAAKLRNLASARRREFRKRLLSLPELSVALEGEDLSKGHCEYYEPVAFVSGPPAKRRGLVRAEPVAIDKGVIGVRYLGDEKE